MLRIIVLVVSLLAGLYAQQPEKSPIAGNPVVDVKGKIVRVNLGGQQGTPYAELDSGGKPVKVYLGSMRYLMTKQFNPKAGQTMTARGYQMEDGVIAISSTLVEEKTTVRLRDENGYPLWRGGDYGQGRQEHRRGQRRGKQ